MDTETTGLSPESEICEIAAGMFINNEWNIKSSLFGTTEPLPFAASATNHITRKMIDGLPLYTATEQIAKDIIFYDDTTYYVAHNAAYDSKIMANSFARMGLTFDKKWICTLRLVNAMFGDELELKNLSYLRYALELDVPDEMIAHRAAEDVFVTAKLFEYLVVTAIDKGLISIDKPIGEQLYDLSIKPKKITKMPFGKHKGVLLSDIPTDYFLWVTENTDAFDEESALYNSDLTLAVTIELEHRLTLTIHG